MQCALEPDGRETVAWEAARAGGYTCPACGERVVLKAGAIVAEHFAHRPGADCALSEGESRRHMEMKKEVALLLGRRGCAVRCEVPLAGRRADLVAGQRVVVECQESPIALDEVVERTRDYNAAGCAVLWVWDLPRLSLGRPARRFAEIGEDEEHAVAAEVREWHRESYGRLYVLDCDGVLMACHLEPAAPRLTDGGPAGKWRDYTPRTRRYLSLHPCGQSLRPYAGSRWRLSLAGFGERTWWTVPAGPEQRAGYVAIVQRGGLYAIECAPEPSARSLPGRRQPGAAPVPVHFIATGDMVGARDRLHRRFASRRVGDTGTFRLSPDDLAALLALNEL